jgi:RNA polymerase sigma factor (sigma-70 family)
MPDGLPNELSRLLAAAGPDQADAAWAEFVRAHSRLLLHVARTLAHDHDAAMDRFAYLLEQLRRDDCRRLRSFVADGRSKFTTWLVVVARRLCLDYDRSQYGRADRATDPEHRASRAERRQLHDLVGAETDLGTLPDPAGRGADDAVVARERGEALAAALAALEPADRLLLRLRFDDAKAASEIARVMGFPTQFHVYRRLDRVLALLRRELESRGIRDAVP